MAFLFALCRLMVMQIFHYEGDAGNFIKSLTKNRLKDVRRGNSEALLLDNGILIDQMKWFETGMREAIYVFSNGRKDLWEHGMRSVLHIQNHVKVHFMPTASEDMSVWRTKCKF